eukprot:7322967-Pyramimonas_sp.AAC.1
MVSLLGAAPVALQRAPRRAARPLRAVRNGARVLIDATRSFQDGQDGPQTPREASKSTPQSAPTAKYITFL